MTGDTQVVPTTTAAPARVRLFQPTQRPTLLSGDWIETSWGRCKVTGRLGQRHADLLECLMHYCESSRETADGRLDLLIDPAKIRRAISDGGHSLQRIKSWMDELAAALVKIDTRDVEIVGHLIDTYRVSKQTRHNPLTGGERNLWVVTLGDAMCELLRLDLPLYYDPAPLCRLEFGISQAVARHVLTHSKPPVGGWLLDGLITAVSGSHSGEIRNRRRELRADTERLDAVGIELKADRVYRR